MHCLVMLSTRDREGVSLRKCSVIAGIPIRCTKLWARSIYESAPQRPLGTQDVEALHCHHGNLCCSIVQRISPRVRCVLLHSVVCAHCSCLPIGRPNLRHRSPERAEAAVNEFTGGYSSHSMLPLESSRGSRAPKGAPWLGPSADLCPVSSVQRQRYPACNLVPYKHLLGG